MDNNDLIQAIYVMVRYLNNSDSLKRIYRLTFYLLRHNEKKEVA